MLSKNDFRKIIKMQREKLGYNSISVISEKIVENILQWDKYITAKNIMIFYPLDLEISLLHLLNDSSKNFYFPVTDKENIRVVLYDKNLGFKKGLFNINEPLGDYEQDLSLLDIVFVPALAVDLYGIRLGYGKGYYDRFFQNISVKAIRAIPVYSEFCYNALPSYVHDEKCDYVITEKSIFRIKNH